MNGLDFIGKKIVFQNFPRSFVILSPLCKMTKFYGIEKKSPPSLLKNHVLQTQNTCKNSKIYTKCRQNDQNEPIM